MGHDRSDSPPLDFERNGSPFGSKSKGNLPPRSYTTQPERKWKHSYLSVYSEKQIQISSQTEQNMIAMTVTRLL